MSQSCKPSSSGIHALISAIRSSFVVSLIKFDFMLSSGDNHLYYLCSFFVLGCSACQKNQRFSWLTGIRPIIDKENSFLPANSHKLFSPSMALLIAYAHYIMKQSFMIVIYTRFARQSLLYHKSFLCANRISCILAEHFLCNRNEVSQYIKKTFCISESLSVHYTNFFIHGNQYAVRPAILLLSEHCRSSWETYNH